MRTLALALAFMLFASIARAGPNAGGVLWVHDTGMMYSADTPLPPESVKPADCADVDNQQDADNRARIWKVYAAFHPGSSPRLKMTAWGIEFPEAATSPYSYVTVNAAGCGVPDEDGPATDFWYGDLGFPTASGGEVGQRFFHARLTTVVTLFYFTGAGYVYAGNNPLPVFALRPHSVASNRFFFDDHSPQNADPIMGYGSLGFGTPGMTPCPVPGPDATGACCDEVTGYCAVTPQSACPLPLAWLGAGVPCNAQTCPIPPTGACCDESRGDCVITPESQCQFPLVWHGVDVPCSDQICPPPSQPTGACCFADLSCLALTQAQCTNEGGQVYLGDCTVCEPNPCPWPIGACCVQIGTCTVSTQAACVPPSIWWGVGTYCGLDLCVARTGPTDLALLLDGSASISPANWIRLKEGVAAGLENPNIIPVDGSASITVVQFGNGIGMIEIPLTTITSAAVASSLATQVRAMVQLGDGTPTAAGVDAAVEAIGAGTPGARQGILVVTDGLPNWPESFPQLRALQAADNAIAAGIDEVHAIGIGSWVNCFLIQLTLHGTSEFIADYDYLAATLGNKIRNILFFDPSTSGLSRERPGAGSLATTFRAAPNPFTESTTLHLAGPPATRTRVLIFDAAGRLVRTAWEGTLDDCEVAITWDGHDQSGRAAAAGIYLVRVEGADGEALGRLIKTR